MKKIKLSKDKISEPTLSEFLYRVFNGDGHLFLINDDIKFNLDLAFQISNIVDEKFLAALHNITAEYKLKQLWKYDYRTDIIEQNSLPIEKPINPPSNEMIKELVSTDDYVQSRWNYILNLKKAELKENREQVRKLLQKNYNIYLSEITELLELLFKYIEDQSHFVISQKKMEFASVSNRERLRNFHINNFGRSFKKIILGYLKLERVIKREELHEFVISKILRESRLQSKLDRLVAQSCGIFELFDSSDNQEDVAKYLTTEFGSSINEEIERFKERAKRLKYRSAELTIDYIIYQIIGWYNAANTECPGLEEISSEIYFDVDNKKSQDEPITLNYREVQNHFEVRGLKGWEKEILNAMHDSKSQIRESTLFIFLLDWFDNNHFLPGMGKSLFDDLSKKFVTNKIIDQAPSQKSITNKLKFIARVKSVPEVEAYLLKLYRRYKKKGSEKLRK